MIRSTHCAQPGYNKTISDSQSMPYSDFFYFYIPVILLLKSAVDLCIRLFRCSTLSVIFGSKFSLSIYFCMRLLIINVNSLYDLSRQVTGLQFFGFSVFSCFAIRYVAPAFSHLNTLCRQCLMETVYGAWCVMKCQSDRTCISVRSLAVWGHCGPYKTWQDKHCCKSCLGLHGLYRVYYRPNANIY
jgi:hypothetical protein